MSVENGKVCCNCRHCIRKQHPIYQTICECEITSEYLGYTRVMTGWCRHWAKDKEVQDADSD